MEPAAMINLINKILDLTDKNVPQPVQDPAIDSLLLNEYNAALVRKLEDKTIALEAANRSLRLEIEEERSVESFTHYLRHDVHMQFIKARSRS